MVFDANIAGIELPSAVHTVIAVDTRGGNQYGAICVSWPARNTWWRQPQYIQAHSEHNGARITTKQHSAYTGRIIEPANKSTQNAGTWYQDYESRHNHQLEQRPHRNHH